MLKRQSIITRPGLVLAFLCALCGISMAQEPMGLNLVYGYQAYAYSDSTSLLELDYQFSERGLTYVDKGNGKIGSLYLRLTLLDAQGRRAMMTDWVTTTPAPADSQDAREMLGVKFFEVLPGAYTAEIYFEDLADRRRRDSASFPLRVRSFSDGQLALSDVEVVTEDVQSTDDASNPFYKNGWALIPNPSGQIIPPFLLLTTYVEIYNTGRIATSEFNLDYSLADSSRKIFYQMEKQIKRPTTGTSAFDINRIDVSELPSGTYYLVIKAVDGLRLAMTDSAMVFRAITISNPEKDQALAARRAATAGNLDVEAIDPIYAGKKEEELEEEFEKARYVAQNVEVNTWKQLLGAEAKARFLTYFWSRRDPSPGTTTNEYRDDYYARVETARTSYRAPVAKRGWDSDRGRILLQYGKPDGIDRHHHDYNRKPFEIWRYQSNNLEFVFVDRGNTGSFNLVHSNAPSEPRDENWESNYAVLDRNFEVRR